MKIIKPITLNNILNTLNNNGYLVIILLWLVLFAWRPIFLGFYHDDWSVIAETSTIGDSFSIERFRAISKMFTNRPGAIIQHYFLSSILGGNSALWQLMVIMLVITTALLLYRLFNSSLTTLGIVNKFASTVAVLFWLSYPWGIGITAWPTSGLALISMILFLLCGLLVLETRTKKGLFYAAVLYFLSCLSYEAFYFQYIIYIILLIIRYFYTKKKNRTLLNDIFIKGVTLTLVQMIAISWSYIANIVLKLGIPKSYSHTFISVMLESLQSIPNILFGSIVYGNNAYIKIIFYALFVGGIIIGLLTLPYLTRNNISKSDRVYNDDFKIHIITIIVSAIGIILPVSVFALAGYTISGAGLFGRTTIGLNYWFSLLILFIISFVMFLIRDNKLLIAIFKLYILALVTYLSVLSIMRLSEWSYAWDLEKSIISKAPISEITRLKSNDLVILNAPYDYRGITVFGAFWDITSAMKYTYPNTKAKFTVQREWKTIWDGKEVKQYNGDKLDNYLWKIPADNVYIWDYFSNSFTRKAYPFEIVSQSGQ